MRDIASPLDGFASPFGPVRGFNPAYLFTASEPGQLMPVDPAYLYQDTAGTTPITATGQSVALHLDQSKGLVLGPERVVNGSFPSDLSGWALGSDAAQVIAIWTASGASLTRGAGGPNGFTQTGVAQVGKTYLITFDVVSGTAAFDAFGVSVVAGGAGAKRFIYTASTTSIQFWPTANNATVVIDNISVKELPGNHDTQATVGSRPIYGKHPANGYRNMLASSEDFSAAVWNKVGGTATPDAGVAPDGTVTADRLQFSSAQTPFQSVTFIVGVTYTWSVYVKSNTGSSQDFRLGKYDGANTASANQSATTSWQRFSYTFTAAGTTSPSVYFQTGTGGTACDLQVWGAQLETGSTATPYQRTGASSGVAWPAPASYDITEAGQPDLHYLHYNGVSSFMVSPTITPGIDKAQVFVGVRKLSDAAIATAVSTGTSAGSFELFAPRTTTGGVYSMSSRGTSVSEAISVTASFIAPATSVLNGLADISGDVAILRVNGVQDVQSTTDQGTGNYLAYPIYTGRRGGTSLPFNGLVYSKIIRFGPNLTADQISATERWMAQRTGVSL